MNREKLVDKFNNSIDNLTKALMFISFLGLSFLLIKITSQFFENNVQSESGFMFAFEAFVYVLEVVISGIFVNIHRDGIGALTAFKNGWHFATILTVIILTFQVEKIQIAYGLTYLHDNLLNEQKEDYKNTLAWKNASEAYAKARKKIEYWEGYKGSEADLLALAAYREQYKRAKADKEYRLKTYKNATTKKADREIKKALEGIKSIEDHIEKKKQSNIAIYAKVEKMALDNMKKIKAKYAYMQSNKASSYSKKAKYWANRVVMFFALVYFIHGVLIVTSEDNFSMKDWLKRLFPIAEEKINSIENEAKKMIGVEEEEGREEEKKNSTALSKEQGRVLGKIASKYNDGDRVSVTDLSKLLGIARSTAGLKMKELEEIGILEKKEGVYYFKDRRGH